jgi:hypothetical protein
VLETPKQRLINSNTLVVTCRVQLPQMRKIRIVELVFWGNLATSILNYYDVNDYILIEGYVSFQSEQNFKKTKKTIKKVKITVVKVSPLLLLNDKRFIHKLS